MKPMAGAAGLVSFPSNSCTGASRTPSPSPTVACGTARRATSRLISATSLRRRVDAPAAVGCRACFGRGAGQAAGGEWVDVAGGPADAGEREGADGGWRPGDASHAIQRGRPSRIRAATQSHTGTSPGRAKPNCTSSNADRPKRTAPLRRKSFRRAKPVAQTRRRQARLRREGRAERPKLPLRRGTRRAGEA